jgi:hypothetical protein
LPIASSTPPMGLSHKLKPVQVRHAASEPTLAYSMGSVRKFDQTIKIFLTE